MFRTRSTSCGQVTEGGGRNSLGNYSKWVLELINEQDERVHVLLVWVTTEMSTHPGGDAAQYSVEASGVLHDGRQAGSISSHTGVNRT